jgi:hypothetical protein
VLLRLAADRWSAGLAEAGPQRERYPTKRQAKKKGGPEGPPFLVERLLFP